MVDDGQGVPQPYVCKLVPDAAELFEGWWRLRRSEASDEVGLWGGWLGKQGGQALRLALILEHVWWSERHANSADSADSHPQTVSRNALSSAITLIDDWAAPMAKRAFGASAASLEESDMAALARWLRRKGLRKFNARKVRRSGDGPGGRLAGAKSMAEACRGLEQAGLIRHIGGRATEGPGRQREDYSVNPGLAVGA
jgi:hypothetical protein